MIIAAMHRPRLHGEITIEGCCGLGQRAPLENHMRWGPSPAPRSPAAGRLTRRHGLSASSPASDPGGRLALLAFTTLASTLTSVREGGAPVRRLCILLLLAGVLSMHGAHYVVTGPGAGDSAPAGADHGIGHPSVASAALSSDSSLSGPPVAAPTEGLVALAGFPTPGDAPDHGLAHHAWSLCLAVLLAGLIALRATKRGQRVASSVRWAVERGQRLSMGWFRPPRPPELSSLCLLRI